METEINRFRIRWRISDVRQIKRCGHKNKGDGTMADNNPTVSKTKMKTFRKITNY